MCVKRKTLLGLTKTCHITCMLLLFIRVCVCVYIYIYIYIYTVYIRKYFYLEYLFFFSFFYQRILKKSITDSKKNKKSAQSFPTFIINKHIGMISEGSRDTEDWSNDAEIQICITEINHILKHYNTIQ